MKEFAYTVIIPAYNRRNLLGRAINSVRKQTFSPHEIVIVDDASSDGTIETLSIEDMPVRIIRHVQNRGAAAARNTGIVNSSTPWLAFLDSDDEWMPGKIEAQFALARQTEMKACLTGYLINDARYGHIRKFVADPFSISQRMLTYGCTLSLGSTLLVRRDVFEEVGLFDPTLRRHEDWDWAIRYSKRYGFLSVPQTLVTIHKKDDPDYSIVQPALEVMRSKHLSYWSGQSSADGRRFMASLLLEEAAGRYYSNQYLKAAYLVCRALMIHPYRNSSFFRMLMRVARRLASPSNRVKR